MSNLKILAIIDAIEMTGPGKGLLQLARTVKELNVEIVIAAFCYAGRRSLFSEAVQQGGIELVPLHPRGRFDSAVIRQLSTLVCERRIDLIQSHSFKPHIYAAILQGRTSRPWIGFAHGWTREAWRTQISNIVERWLLKRPDHVVVLSAALEEDLRRSGRTRPISVVMNAIEPLDTRNVPGSRARARADLGIAGASCVLLCIGRLSREKGQDILLESLQRVLPTVERPIVLLLAGDGPERERLICSAKRLEGRVSVRFLGHVTTVDQLYDVADLLVMPSRSEGTPNVILEAMRSALPIVATNVGSVSSMLSVGQALLVESGDCEALAKGIQAMYEDTRRSREMGEVARAALWPRFSVETRARRMVQIYDQALHS